MCIWKLKTSVGTIFVNIILADTWDISAVKWFLGSLTSVKDRVLGAVVTEYAVQWPADGFAQFHHNQVEQRWAIILLVIRFLFYFFYSWLILTYHSDGSVSSVFLYSYHVSLCMCCAFIKKDDGIFNNNNNNNNITKWYWWVLFLLFANISKYNVIFFVSRCCWCFSWTSIWHC